MTATQGLPASGKTTWARAQVLAAPPGSLVRFNRDETRQMLHCAALYLPVTEKQVTVVQHGAVEAMLRYGADVLVDDTNLDPEHLGQLVAIAHRAGAEVRIQSFVDVSLEECVRRDRVREDSVGAAIIHAMHERYVATGEYRNVPSMAW
ncbi:AAA family ATPase [Saccharothrix xinjiangensis]|uniref:AAA family ATPase n=1 Tax=Saccharothrix xinjiangensis TaxID=204798 RepID=A0ABV9XZ49_9PSEU